MLIKSYSTVVCVNVDGINVNNFMRLCVKAELKELSVEYCHLYGGRELPIEKSAFLKENCFLFYFDLHFFLFFNLFFYF